MGIKVDIKNNAIRMRYPITHFYFGCLTTLNVCLITEIHLVKITQKAFANYHPVISG